MLSGIGWILIGLWAIWLARKTSRTRQREMALHHELYLERLQRTFDQQRHEAKLLIADFRNKVSAGRETGTPRVISLSEELDQMVLTDALKREERAKQALVAVLRRNGLSESQVDDVLKSVDGDDAKI